MSKDPIESLAMIPAPDANFDELWIVVNRANGRFVERMARRLATNGCSGVEQLYLEDQIFLDSAISYENGATIELVTIDIDQVITITIHNHGFSEGDTVRLTNVQQMPELNDRRFIIENVTTNEFDLGDEVF